MRTVIVTRQHVRLGPLLLSAFRTPHGSPLIDGCGTVLAASTEPAGAGDVLERVAFGGIAVRLPAGRSLSVAVQGRAVPLVSRRAVLMRIAYRVRAVADRLDPITPRIVSAREYAPLCGHQFSTGTGSHFDPGVQIDVPPDGAARDVSACTSIVCGGQDACARFTMDGECPCSCHR
jgi:hypothetical protein